MRRKSGGRREKQDITAQQRGEEPTRDDREWKEIITNPIPDVKNEYEQEKRQRKATPINNRSPVRQWSRGRLALLQ